MGVSTFVPCPGASPKTPILETPGKHRLTVADAIGMTRLADPLYTAAPGISSNGLVAQFSPDGRQFVIVLRSGNLKENTNRYSMLLWRRDTLFHSPRPRLLLAMSSSSNREGIKNVRWQNDNDTILFLGERAGERTQLYSIKCNSGVLRQLTNHTTNLVSFASTGDRKRIAYMAEIPPSSFVTDYTLRFGVHVKHELLSDLIRGEDNEEYADHNLYVREAGTRKGRKLEVSGHIESFNNSVGLSPNGNYVVVQTEVQKIPETWREYEDELLQLFLHQKHSAEDRTGIYHYELVDTRTGATRALVEAPISTTEAGSEFAWSPDSKSVIVSNVYLPLDGTDSLERALRKSHPFLVEIKIPSGQLLPISDKDLRLLGWEASTNKVICEIGRIGSLTGKPVPRIQFQKSGNQWLEAPAAVERTNRPEIGLEENINLPPRIIAVDPTTGRKVLLLDLNPQFKSRSFGKVEEIKWKDTLGNEVRGGLYWPTSYVAGTKYPLIIQTHGFNPNRFSIDGPWTTAFAAQPLAGEGFFVLQVPDLDAVVWGTTKEAPRAMAVYEGAIDYLATRDLINVHRIGIIGFSRTCLYVTYTLTHSRYEFTAATIADGIDGGYFPSMAFGNSLPRFVTELAAINGAPPFGDGLSAWMKSSPEFRIDKVRTPLRIQALGAMSLLTDWDWFSGMYQLNKPVDLIYLPDATHILEKPWERMVSQQGDVDWFDFWLRGYEDLDPSKSDQYKHWHELRRLQAGDGAANLSSPDP